MEKRQVLMEEYQKCYELLNMALQEAPGNCLKYKPSEDQWSIHEIVLHISDSEALHYIRLRTLIAENGGEVQSYDQNTWANELLYHEQDLQVALELIRTIRKSNAQLISLISDDIWATHAISHPEHGTITFDDWLKINVDHIHQHIAQIQKNISAFLTENAAKKN